MDILALRDAVSPLALTAPVFAGLDGVPHDRLLEMDKDLALELDAHNLALWKMARLSKQLKRRSFSLLFLLALALILAVTSLPSIPFLLASVYGAILLFEL